MLETLRGRRLKNCLHSPLNFSHTELNFETIVTFIDLKIIVFTVLFCDKEGGRLSTTYQQKKQGEFTLPLCFSTNNLSRIPTNTSASSNTSLIASSAASGGYFHLRNNQRSRLRIRAQTLSRFCQSTVADLRNC